MHRDQMGGGTHRSASWPVLAAILVAIAACAPNQATPEADRSGPSVGGQSAPDTTGERRDPAREAAKDTLRGTIAVVGSEPATLVVLRPVGGGGEIALHGDPTRDLRRLSGLEVWVEGRRSPSGARPGAAPGAGSRSFTVERFAVRALDGVPAVDGILVEEGDVVFLRLRNGELRRLARPPAELRRRIGAWVWFAGSLEGEVMAYGVIREGEG